MTKLLRLDLPLNELKGTLDILGEIPNLKAIQLSQNPLNGSIPFQFCNMTQLEVISIGHSHISGQIPECFGYNNPNLRMLSLENCRYLNSTFPESLVHLSGVKWMQMTHSNIRGKLPMSFGRYFYNVIQILLSFNHLEGEIPSNLTNMKHLTHFDISANKFHGKIPSTLVSLPSLYALFLQNNSLTELPPKRSVCRQLDMLDISYNKFNKTMDAVLGIFKGNPQLHTLKLKDIGLYGEFSDSFWNIWFLNYFDASDNQISGQLPTLRTEIPYLILLDLNNNNLTGRIPKNYRQLESLKTLNLTRNPNLESDDKTFDIELLNWNPNDIQQYEGNYKCPNLEMTTATNGQCQVFVNPSYFHYMNCTCNFQFYGSLGRCLPCWKEGGVCTGGINDSKMFWPANKYPSNVTKTFVDCALPIGGVMFCNPTGNCSCSYDVTNNVTVCNERCLCNPDLNLKGRRCLECKDKDYFKDGNKCYPCVRYSAFTLLFSILIVFLMICASLGNVYYSRNNIKKAIVLVKLFLLILTLLLCLLQTLPVWVFPLTLISFLLGISKRENKCVGLIKICVFFGQTLSVIIHTFPNLGLDFLFQAEQFLQSTFDIHLSSLECYWKFLRQPYGRLLLIIALPPISLFVCIVTIVSGHIIYRIQQRNRYVEIRDNDIDSSDDVIESESGFDWKLFRYRCFGFFLFVSDILYFPIVKVTLTALSPCFLDPLDNKAYMESLPTVQCSTVLHQHIYELGLVALFVEIIGLWLMFASVLYVYQRRYLLIQRNLTMNGEVRIKELLCIKALLSPLLGPYRDQYQYIELLFLTKRALIAIVVTYIPRQSILHPLALIAILMPSLLLQIRTQPFKHSGFITILGRRFSLNLENWLYEAVLLFLQLSIIGSAFLTLQLESFYSDVSGKLFIIFVIAANTSLFLLLIMAMVARLVNIGQINEARYVIKRRKSI